MEKKQSKNNEPTPKNSKKGTKHVETIVDVRGRGRKTEYLVKWLDYDDNHNSWELSSSLEAFKDILDLFRARRIRAHIKTYQTKRTQSRDRNLHAMKRKPRSSSLKNRPNLSVTVNESEKSDKEVDNGSKVNRSEIEFIEGLKESLDLNKQETVVKNASCDTKADDERYRMIKSKIEVVLENLDKKISRASTNKSQADKSYGHELIDARKLPDGTTYVTTDQIIDTSTLKVTKEDLRKAIEVKRRCIISDKVYFLLRWSNKKVDDFYSNHYFSYKEMESYNPVLLLGYLKDCFRNAIDN